MGIVAYLYLLFALASAIFVFSGFIIENFLPEEHPATKWWHRCTDGPDSENQDDIYK
jgi:hypothetical protein